jgi:hypothetical protein
MMWLAGAVGTVVRTPIIRKPAAADTIRDNDVMILLLVIVVTMLYLAR